MRPARRHRFRYDVFISYSHRNQAWVREWLVPQLKNAGLSVCIDHESSKRVRSLGLITGMSHNEAQPRCRLYAVYFQRVLS